MSAALQPLSGLDALFLHIETPEMPMHVGSLELFELPRRYRGDFHHDVKQHIGARLHLAPAFTRRLVALPLQLANPLWRTDCEVDLDHHVRRAVLPKPGTPEQLHACVGRLHAGLLDRSRPLWQMTVIEGLASGERALYTKVHHAAVDGAAGAALTLALMDLEPDATHEAPVRCAIDSTEPSLRELLVATGANTVVQVRRLGAMLPQAAGVGRSAAGAALRTALRRATSPRSSGPGTAPPAPSSSLLAALALAPRTPLNGIISRQRSFATTSIPLATLKATAKALEATINDLVMAVCSTALRAWLMQHAEVPAQSLVAAVPFSLRTVGNTEQNNQVSMMLADLATQEQDPLQRLAAIRASMARGKRVTGGLKALIPTDFPSLGLPWLLMGLARLYSNAGLAERMRPIANVVVSNVMGPQVPLYLAGARMTHYWPVSICVHGVALNITVQSYAGEVDFGLIACRKTLPRLDELARLIDAAAAEYAALAAAAAEQPAAASAQPARRRRPVAAHTTTRKSGRVTPRRSKER